MKTDKIKTWFYWVFDRKSWVHFESKITGIKIYKDINIDCFPTGWYPQVIQVWRHPKGYIKEIETFIFKLSVLEEMLGIKCGTWTGPK